MLKSIPLLLTASLLSVSLSASASSAPERVLLQKLAADSITIKWRYPANETTAEPVCVSAIGQVQQDEPHCAASTITDGGHGEATITGLRADTLYQYQIGDLSDPHFRFRTPADRNALPADGNTRILIVGDSGTQSEPSHAGEAAQVTAGYRAYNTRLGNQEALDLFVVLGDTAYVVGTDQQWQQAFFEVYPDILSSTLVLPTIGNHEMGYGSFPCEAMRMCGDKPAGTLLSYGGLSFSADPNSYDGNRDGRADPNGLPYLSIFSLPQRGESGGVASGTEQYYSVDYNNVHVVSLDSQLSARDPAQMSAMRDWLISDLSANELDWTVVIFHHPPYSKGTNHDSDSVPQRGPVDMPQKDMREQFTPLFEAHGVDMVFSGHSHSYERSYYLRGLSVSSPEMAPLNQYTELDQNGKPDAGRTRPYSQLSETSGGVDDRVIYTVAGNGGKADAAPGPRDNAEQWLRHPAHVPQPTDQLDGGCSSDHGCHHGLAVKGSVVLDADRHSLRARFVDVNGDVLDEFTITR